MIKNKNSEENTPSDSNDSLQIDDKNSVEDESLELELEFEPSTTENESIIEEDEFPKVDEPSLSEKEATPPEIEQQVQDEILTKETKQTQQRPVQDELTKTDNDTLASDNSASDNSNSLEDSPLELVDEPASDDNSVSKTISVDETYNEDNETEEEKTKPEIKKPDVKNYEQAENSKTKRIESEQALSALINKSNQHSRNEQLKRTVTIAIFVTLILIGSGLYFYIEMQTTSQDLYISQNNNDSVNRNTEAAITQTPVIEKKTVKQPANNQAINKTPAKRVAKIKPETQAAVVSKSVTTHQAINKPISIVRTKKSDPIHLLIRDAYSAFHNQDYRKSESLYKKALKREPRNRDALLGLAAIGIKEQRYEYARQKYQYLLKLNPRDTIATAGMSSIENRIDPQLNESQLKFMLKDQPDAAHLYFALGSLYSGQEKWPEAQSAYFSAWSAENKNADYAYNLAVSLDHLDKQKQALDFYKLSLKLKQASSGNFSDEDTQQRIYTLQESNK